MRPTNAKEAYDRFRNLSPSLYKTWEALDEDVRQRFVQTYEAFLTEPIALPTVEFFEMSPPPEFGFVVPGYGIKAIGIPKAEFDRMTESSMADITFVQARQLEEANKGFWEQWATRDRSKDPELAQQFMGEPPPPEPICVCGHYLGEHTRWNDPDRVARRCRHKQADCACSQFKEREA